MSVGGGQGAADVSDGAEVTRALRESENRLTAVVDNMPAVVFLRDPDGKFILVNRAYEETYRVAKETIAGKTLADVFDESQAGEYADHDREVVEQRRTIERELTIRLDGEEHTFASVHFPVKGLSDAVIAVGGIEHDITERKRAEDELARSRTALEVTLENMDQGISMVDGDLNVTTFNQRFLELLEFPASLFDGNTSLENLFRFNAERAEYGPGDAEAQVAERMALARRFEPHRFERTRPDGTVIEIRGKPVAGGGFVTTYTDISERRRAERALRESEERHALAIEGANDGLWDWNIESGEIHVSPHARELLGLEGGAATTTPEDWNARVHADDFERRLEIEEAHLRGETEFYTDEYRVRGADGTYHWVLDRGACLRDAEGRAYRMAGSLGDITERKQGELFLRTVVDTIPASLNIRDVEGRYVLINRRLADYYGVDPQDTAAKFPEQAFPQSPTDEKEEEEFQEVMKTASAIVDSEYRYETEDGGDEIWLTTRQPILGDAGELQYVLTVSYDITDRKRAEQDLAEKEAQLRLALDHMPGGMRLVDKGRNYVLLNSQYVELYEFPEGLLKVGESILVQNLYQAERGDFGPGDPEELAIAPIGDVTDWERTTPLGKILQISTAPTPDGGLVSVATDITDRKRAEEELRSANEASAAAQTRLLDAIESLPAAFVLYDSDDRLLLCNGRFRDLFGYSKEEAIAGVSHGELFKLDVERGNVAADIDEHDYFKQRVTLRREREGVSEVQFMNGRWLQMHERTTSEGGLVSVQVDITDRRRAEEELRTARDQAETATRAKAAFLATMSHEIRTPMNGVIGMIDLLRQTKLDEDQRQMMTTVRDSAFALLTIIDDILDFSKIEAGKLEFEAIPVSVRDVVEGVAETLAPTVRKKGIRLSTFIDPEIPDAVTGDPVRLRQILFNLGGNAVKFTEAGTVVIRVDREANGADGAVAVRFRVEDTGIGISEDAQPMLFVAFSQIEGSTTRRFGGTGLGLSICVRLTEMMGGTIDLESTPGEGSVFSVNVTMPVAEKHAIKSDGHDMGGLNLLLVVADEEVRGLVARYLAHWGAAVTQAGEIAATASLALEAAGDGTPFDVVVLGSAWDSQRHASVCTSIAESPGLSDTRFVLLTTDRVRDRTAAIENAVFVESNPLKRAKFIRSVAVAAGRASPEVDYGDEIIDLGAAKAPTVAEAADQGRLILVAEDNVTNQDVIQRQLNLLGYAAEVVDDGRQALEAWRAKPYAVLLTDCNMPVMDGYQLAAAIRDEERGGEVHVPIVAITANALQGEIDRCFEAGMDDYLSKPLEMPKLKETLGKWMPVPEFGSPRPVVEELAAARAEDGSDEGEAGPVDLRALTDVFGDDADTIRDILADFVDPAWQTVADIEDAFERRSAQDVGALGHDLKSSSRQIGAHGLADLCAALERAGKDDDWPTIERNAPKLRGCMSEVAEFIDEQS